MKELVLTSPAFSNGGWIPDRYSGYGDNVSPELDISGLDEKAISLIITLDDMDHPIPSYNHWVAWNLPPISVIPENLPKCEICENPIHIEQGIAYGKHCYRGPKPPFNWNHEYRFTVYALDIKLSINTNANRNSVLKAAEGHILQKGVLIGKYQRKHN